MTDFGSFASDDDLMSNAGQSCRSMRFSACGFRVPLETKGLTAAAEAGPKWNRSNRTDESVPFPKP
jgi:hypothetical protein